MNKRFPQYASEREASCFNCNTPLRGIKFESGMPDGSGRYQLTCHECRMMTFFDLKKFMSNGDANRRMK